VNIILSTSTLPQGSCDSHVHIFGHLDQYPMALDRTYTPIEASVRDLQNHLKSLDLTRTVLIQPSVYGEDNRCMITALAELKDTARGVAVLPIGIGFEELAHFHIHRVRGVRLNIASRHNPQDPWTVSKLQQEISSWTEKLSAMSKSSLTMEYDTTTITCPWHIQVFCEPSLLTEAFLPMLQNSTKLVIDHVGLMTPKNLRQSKMIDQLLKILVDGQHFMKLSASYRLQCISERESNNLSAFVNLLTSACPDQLLWASDWPHTNLIKDKSPLEEIPFRNISKNRLQEELFEWLATEDLVQKIMVKNPEKIYGFKEIQTS